MFVQEAADSARLQRAGPAEVEWDEPQRVAEAIFLMKVKHAVITSVDRDELKDGGSIIWQNTIRAVKALTPDTTLETLIPDLRTKRKYL
jgi:lipoic acid synthetase